MIPSSKWLRQWIYNSLQKLWLVFLSENQQQQVTHCYKSTEKWNANAASSVTNYKVTQTEVDITHFEPQCGICSHDDLWAQGWPMQGMTGEGLHFSAFSFSEQYWILRVQDRLVYSHITVYTYTFTFICMAAVIATVLVHNHWHNPWTQDECISFYCRL